ncbi:hypothetical protein ACERK3_11590 [Phycisphaerales bacterium AB-hyl4]|uniref:Uncharacterized protein n=1 Tax=Natronomicrosphaera hydrolytica TaxID=3242702 RepID=A0ABV4U858_9BACT
MEIHLRQRWRAAQRIVGQLTALHHRRQHELDERLAYAGHPAFPIVAWRGQGSALRRFPCSLSYFEESLPMTVIPASRLQPSDLRRLGHDLCDQVRADHQACHHPVDRSLAVHGEQLSDEDLAALEAATISEHVAS